MFESERRDLSFVPRWSIIRCTRRQSVADHTYYATCYAFGIAKFIDWPNPPDDAAVVQLLVYLLRHDESEALESDIPGPIKRMAGFDGSKLAAMLAMRFGPPAPRTDDMVRIRKTADLLDECMYLAGELNGGNQFVKSALKFSTNCLKESMKYLPGTIQKQRDLWLKFEDMIEREIVVEKLVIDIPHNHHFTAGGSD